MIITHLGKEYGVEGVIILLAGNKKLHSFKTTLPAIYSHIFPIFFTWLIFKFSSLFLATKSTIAITCCRTISGRTDGVRLSERHIIIENYQLRF